MTNKVRKCCLLCKYLTDCVYALTMDLKAENSCEKFKPYTGDMVTSFMGKPISYWIELENNATCMNTEKIILENTRLKESCVKNKIKRKIATEKYEKLKEFTNKKDEENAKIIEELLIENALLKRKINDK